MRVKFTKHQWEQLSEICSNIGIVFAGSIVVPVLFDKFSWQMLILGLVGTVLAFYLSMTFARKY